MVQLSPMPPVTRPRQRSTPPLIPRARSTESLERNLFVLTLALAIGCYAGTTARAIWLGGRVARMEQELDRQNVSIREEALQCRPGTVSPACDAGARESRRHDLEVWSASTNATRGERDQWNEWGILAAVACIGLYYAIRLAITGRIRPLWPLAR